MGTSINSLKAIPATRKSSAAHAGIQCFQGHKIPAFARMTIFRGALIPRLLLSTLCLSFCHGIFAGKDYKGANYTSYTGFKVPEKAVLPNKETHPSLWLSKDELEEGKERFQQDKRGKALWDLVEQHRFLKIDIPKELSLPSDAKTVHKYYGTMTQLALYNAFMFSVEADSTLKKYYFERAKQSLLRTYDGPIYQLDPRKSGVDKGVDEIYRGIWNQSLSAAYDFLQPQLNSEDDKEIRRRLIKEAQYTYENIDTWAAGPHNHLSKPAWGLATLALTLSDHPKAKHWLRKAHQAANRNTSYHFSADGIYREGALYYIFSWLNYVPYLYHYKNVSGVDLFETFLPSMEWGLIARNGRGWMMNIEDSFLRPVPTHMVAAPYLKHRSKLNPEVTFGEILQWGFVNTDFKPFDEAEKKWGFNYTGASWDYPKELYDLLTYNPHITPQPPSIDPTVFMEGGQSIFRNQWLDKNRKQMYLLFHGVPHADNHDHHDHLSFVMYAKGQMMASDSGYTRKSYGEDIRYVWYRQAPAHNTLTLDGVPLGDAVENQAPTSRHRLNTDFFDFEQKEAPFRMYLDDPTGTAKRAIAFIQDHYFLVLDQANTLENREGVFRRYFHGGRVTLDKMENHHRWSYKEDKYGSKAQLLSYQLNPTAEEELFRAESTYIKGDFTQTPALITKQMGTEVLFAQILYPLGKGETQAQVQNLSTKDYLAARLEGKFGPSVTSSKKTLSRDILPPDILSRDLFFFQADKQSLQVEGLESNAKFAWYRTPLTDKPSNTVKLAMQEGTFLGNHKLRYVQASKPTTLALAYDSNGVTGAIEVRAGIKLKIRVSKHPIKTVSINQEDIPFSQEADWIEFTVKNSGQLRIH